MKTSTTEAIMQPLTATQSLLTAKPEILEGLRELWAETQGGPDIRVAVLDGPIDLSHPCFQGARLEVLPTLVPGNGGGSAHGTHVASLIFGQPGSPVRGIAPGCTGLILPVFAQRPDGSLKPCSQMNLARAIHQAIEAGAHVINISGGELSSSGEAVDLLADAIRQAADRDVLIVAATGNDGCECLHMPAGLDPVLAVGALDQEGQPLGSSNWSQVLAERGLMAPGHRILGAVPPEGIARLSGTSFATPLVAGAAALLLSLQSGRGERPDPVLVRSVLLRSARRCDPVTTSDCRRFMAGTLDLAAARAALAGTAPSAIDSQEQVTRRLDSLSLLDSPLQHSIEGEEKMKDDLVLSAQDTGPAPASGASISASCACEGARLDLQTIEPAPTLLTSHSAGPLTGLLPAVSPSGIAPACNNDAFSTAMRPFPSGQKVFALGKLYYDFGTEARRDYFASALGKGRNIYNPADMAKWLKSKTQDEPNMDSAIALIWTLYIDQDPVYALVPQDQFALLSFERLCKFLLNQVENQKGLYRTAFAGTIQGTITLFNGTVVPVLSIATRAMWDWTVKALAAELAGGDAAEAGSPSGQESSQNGPFENFMLRIYSELRNLGVSSSDRAKNYAATNAHRYHEIFTKLYKEDFRLDKITTERSPICRRDSDCWDVKLRFFYPKDVYKVARKVCEFTIDVSDIVPVPVGDIREYEVHVSS